MPSSTNLTAASSVAPAPRSWLERLWSTIADRGRPYAHVPDASAPPLDRATRLADALLSERGEASGAAVARELHAALRGFDLAGRTAFYRFVSAGFGPDVNTLRAAAEAYLAEPTPAQAVRLAAAAEPPRQELLRRMNIAPGGTAALLRMREELLGLLRAEPGLRVLDSDLRHLFASWFNRGFLELRRIDWQTQAAVLEKLIAYEAVHEIQGWDDLRHRLDADRRCFAFFHPALPGEPLIFVEVALVQGLAEAVQPLLSRDEPPGDPARADTAIFYSISNCQEGLRGISFGNFLIKQVVEELKAELPQITRFSTLSPVPGFRRWLDRQLAGPGTESGSAGAAVFSPEEARRLSSAVGGTVADIGDAFRKLTGEDGWWQDPARAELLRAPLLRLCATYLMRPDLTRPDPTRPDPTRPGQDGRAVDPVARFHLGNGARLERINWLGNTSARGMHESFGMMVNYLYDPDAIEANHEAYVHSGKVAHSAQIDALLSPRAPQPEPPPTKPRLSRIRGG
ncbi:MAG TPA: malonyl-CoA decarboxylase [Rhodopila sp.]|nr:malonyl-CoA decarboxylase [Rhodopila sp.]